MNSLRLFLAVLMVVTGVGWVSSAHAAPPGAPNPALMAGCTQEAFYDASTSGATVVVTHSGGTQIYPCGFVILASAGSVNVGLVYGSGTNCGTGSTKITPAFQMTTTTPAIVDHQAVYTGLLAAPSGNDLCINTSGSVAVQAIVYFVQF